MPINRNLAAFSLGDENGLLFDNGVHVSSGVDAPDEFSHTNPLAGDKYARTNGEDWVYNGTIWVRSFDNFSPEGSNNLFNSSGEVITSNSFSVVSTGSLRGSGGTGLFIAVGNAAQGGTDMTVRLWNVSEASELASLLFTSGVELRKEVSFTLPVNPDIVEVQAMKNGGSGTLFSAEVK